MNDIAAQLAMIETDKAIREQQHRERLRDTFAAAALTGLLSSMQKNVYAEEMASHAYEMADAMLRERERHHIPDAGKMVESPTNHDAAPAARACTDSAAGEPGDGGGCGGTDKPVTLPAVAWAVLGDGYEYVSMTPEMCVAWASENGGRTVPLYATPQPPCTPGEGSVQGGCTSPKSYRESDEKRVLSDTKREPVAWAILHKDHQYVSLLREHAVARRVYEDAEIVPLYRSPTLTDEEREAIEAAALGLDGKHSLDYMKRARQAATLRSLLERLK